ncbi:ferredoxin [Streptomyces acidiscabies]|uniref:Ferredoxin n=1 Tax=Streptomyces acidiscabies TaxID=42234 RepID=A0AAP6B7H6_9ACTN|nr:ferredoxin [Streptomyces acidiscabies]MBP5939337.1 ferredoxin [Streptomyces sp. LBUM 1476]MBZ3910470.1 ferredoxin [Streptomyces acidiscabies]MDX2959468.1 ferredoxin [Streptomyces acidiscabies]MDX3019244.1 ferredoxin [Streptomyces acidiscabies]MDX3790675.1 ferredoxin [Streptomyces acidiscabies]
MKITVDEELCCASGLCTVQAGEVFDQDDDGIVVLLSAAPGPEYYDAAREAAAVCPAAAIRITE